MVSLRLTLAALYGLATERDVSYRIWAAQVRAAPPEGGCGGVPAALLHRVSRGLSAAPGTATDGVAHGGPFERLHPYCLTGEQILIFWRLIGGTLSFLAPSGKIVILYLDLCFK